MRYEHPTQIPRSETLRGIEWTTDMIRPREKGIRGDTYAQTWAADDNLYLGTGDPCSVVLDGKKKSVYGRADVEKGLVPPDEEGYYIITPDYTEIEKDAQTKEIYSQCSGACVERLSGNPEDMKHERINNLRGLTGFGGFGAKPSGMISVKGVLYYALQNLLGDKPTPEGTGVCQVGSDASIICSEDFGKTWYPDIETPLQEFYGKYFDIREKYSVPPEERCHAGNWKPMFAGNLFGGPSFIQFGRDNQDAVDEYVYAVSGEQWDNGNHLRLGRVPNDIILERSEWEFAVLSSDNQVSWTKDLYKCTPVLSITRHIGIPEMVYLKSIKKYLLLTWGFHRDFYPYDGSELTVLESDHPWGPFRLVHYEWMWYKQEAGLYCPRIPMKWFDQKTMSGYMLQAGNWSFPAPRPYYMPLLRGFRIVMASL